MKALEYVKVNATNLPTQQKFRYRMILITQSVLYIWNTFKVVYLIKYTIFLYIMYLKLS